jgi:glucose-1-phosphate cytidylyltransferase
VLSSTDVDDWEVTLVDTGQAAMTGARVARAAAKYLGGEENFAVTYGDGLTDANLAEELSFHLAHGKTGTILGVNPPSRFGELRADGTSVLEFLEKPTLQDSWINGGYDECVLERQPLARLAEDGELEVCKHDGYWASMDTQRDRDELEVVWATGRAPGKAPEGDRLPGMARS